MLRICFNYVDLIEEKKKEMREGEKYKILVNKQEVFISTKFYIHLLKYFSSSHLQQLYPHQNQNQQSSSYLSFSEGNATLMTRICELFNVYDYKQYHECFSLSNC